MKKIDGNTSSFLIAFKITKITQKYFSQHTNYNKKKLTKIYLLFLVLVISNII